MARAVAETRIVLTHDKDFGELTFGDKAHPACGVILIRVSGDAPETDNKRILQVLQDRQEWQGHFTVVTNDRIRIRPLPKQARHGQ